MPRSDDQSERQRRDARTISQGLLLGAVCAGVVGLVMVMIGHLIHIHGNAGLIVTKSAFVLDIVVLAGVTVAYIAVKDKHSSG